MKEIELSKGRMALVDDEDYDWISQWSFHSWTHKKCNTHYARRRTIVSEGFRPRKDIFMHRVILKYHNFKFGNLQVDHKDGNGLNNQKDNLRLVTIRQNKQNIKNSKIKLSSKHPGVSWCVLNKKWTSKARINGIKKSLGYFTSETEAAQVYVAAIHSQGELVIGEI